MQSSTFNMKSYCTIVSVVKYREIFQVYNNVENSICLIVIWCLIILKPESWERAKTSWSLYTGDRDIRLNNMEHRAIRIPKLWS